MLLWRGGGGVGYLFFFNWPFRLQDLCGIYCPSGLEDFFLWEEGGGGGGGRRGDQRGFHFTLAFPIMFILSVKHP
jgi:hypothetical protein